MKVTVILKDFTEAFYDGFGDIVGLLQMSDSDKFAKLNKMAHEKRVKMRIGNGQFREAVELNQIMRAPKSIEFKIEPRKGYKLATFDIV
jgi:hypothetical protein